MLIDRRITTTDRPGMNPRETDSFLEKRIKYSHELWPIIHPRPSIGVRKMSRLTVLQA